MFNYYLFHRSYKNATIKEIERNLQDLNDIVINERRENDYFFKHEDSIWNVETSEGNFYEVVYSKLEDKQFVQSVLPKLFSMIKSIPDEILSFECFDGLYKSYNAFYGINFTNFDLDCSRCLYNKKSYENFREKNLWEITPDSFWERRELLFSKKIIFCSDVREQIKKSGNTYLNQIVTKLKELDRYVVQYWKNGKFSYVDANRKTALNISPESEKTMSQQECRNLRTFSLPDGRKECFELHIKTGYLRFHFFPDDGKIFIGYIGKHLKTADY
ncbi:MAG: hypothetical protein LBC02_12070 [Planctomycetaceae bacterium]|jgi:hypothetical protein|nr:hypothetical protein [Planctomycetaceae bacterium]